MAKGGGTTRQDWGRGQGQGRGARRADWGGWVARGRELELTEGYKYPPEPDDHTVSQIETDGSALAEHLATLAPRDTPPQTRADPPSLFLFLCRSL